jgi:hypothetical protein
MICGQNHRGIGASWVILSPVRAVLVVVDFGVRGRIRNDSAVRATKNNLFHMREAFVAVGGYTFVRPEDPATW